MTDQPAQPAPPTPQGEPQEPTQGAQEPLHGQSEQQDGQQPQTATEAPRAARRGPGGDQLRAYQWPKGVSGNPSGRPVRRPFFEQVLRYAKEMAKALNAEAVKNKRTPMIDEAEAHGLAAFLFVKEMAKGSWPALKEYIDRHEGVLTVKVEQNTSVRELAAEEFNRYVGEKMAREAQAAQALQVDHPGQGGDEFEEPRDVELETQDEGDLPLSPDDSGVPQATSPSNLPALPASIGRAPTPVADPLDALRAPEKRALRIEDIVGE